MHHQAVTETQAAAELTTAGTSLGGSWLLPASTLIAAAIVIAVVVVVIRERHHRKKRAKLEAQLADLEGVLSTLAASRSGNEAPAVEPEPVEQPVADESFSPRGPLSTAISTLRNDLGPILPGPDRVDLRATCYVYENLSRPLTPADVADGLNLSLRSLQRGLSSSLGCTPRELILGIKMREAKRSLIEDEARVQEAARTVGFDDPFHFSRRFKSYYGVSPTEMQSRINRSVA